jgi:hypothetical protein
MVDSSLIQPSTIWLHKKGGHYVVIAIGTGCGGGIEGVPLVIYERLHDHKVYVRSLAEFADGRFTSDPYMSR